MMKNTFDVTVVNEVPKVDIDNILRLLTSKKYKSELTLLGSGSSGKVYEYIDVNNMSYALKIIEHFCDSDKDIEFLERLQGLECFPKLYAYSSNSEVAFTLTEKVKGNTLGVYYKKYRANLIAQTKEEYISFFKKEGFEKLSNAINYCIFEKNIMTNDIHPENIMYDEEKNIPIIVDLGLFRKIESYNLGELDFSISRIEYSIDRIYECTFNALEVNTKSIREYLMKEKMEVAV